MNQSDSTLPPATRREVEERLENLRAARGYLLPHHGLLAVATPDLLDAYDATYSTLTLESNHLSEQTKEFVWLTMLGATRVSVGTHHIRRWRDSGGSDAKFEAALKLAAYAQGVAVFGQALDGQVDAASLGEFDRIADEVPQNLAGGCRIERENARNIRCDLD